MDKTFILETPATSVELFAVVSDLETYPEWINFVHRVEDAAPADTASDEVSESRPSGEQAWWVTLRARLGPLARSKRLRMIRSECTPPNTGRSGRVRFERQEVDGRDHADWVLEVEVRPSSAAGSEAHCRLAYSGTLWTAPLEPLLDQGADESAQRLSALVAEAR